MCYFTIILTVVAFKITQSIFRVCVYVCILYLPQIEYQNIHYTWKVPINLKDFPISPYKSKRLG